MPKSILTPVNSYPGKKRGFTLIELLVAVSLLIVLSAIGFATYTNSQKYSRDAKRKQDLKAIAIALEFYYQTNKHYPCNNSATSHDTSYGKSYGSWWISATGPNCDGTGTVIGFNQSYIDVMPLDPINNGDLYTGYSNYSYTYNNGANGGEGGQCGPGKGYILRARLENTADQDSCYFKRNKRCDGVDLCSDGSPTKDTEYYIIAS